MEDSAKLTNVKMLLYVTIYFLKNALFIFVCVTLLQSHRIIATVVYLVSPNVFILFLIRLFFFYDLNFTLLSTSGQVL